MHRLCFGPSLTFWRCAATPTSRSLPLQLMSEFVPFRLDSAFPLGQIQVFRDRLPVLLETSAFRTSKMMHTRRMPTRTLLSFGTLSLTNRFASGFWVIRRCRGVMLHAAVTTVAGAFGSADFSFLIFAAPGLIRTTTS